MICSIKNSSGLCACDEVRITSNDGRIWGKLHRPTTNQYTVNWPCWEIATTTLTKLRTTDGRRGSKCKGKFRIMAWSPMSLCLIPNPSQLPLFFPNKTEKRKEIIGFQRMWCHNTTTVYLPPQRPFLPYLLPGLWPLGCIESGTIRDRPSMMKNWGISGTTYLSRSISLSW